MTHNPYSICISQTRCHRLLAVDDGKARSPCVVNGYCTRVHLPSLPRPSRPTARSLASGFGTDHASVFSPSLSSLDAKRGTRGEPTHERTLSRRQARVRFMSAGLFSPFRDFFDASPPPWDSWHMKPLCRSVAPLWSEIAM